VNKCNGVILVLVGSKTTAMASTMRKQTEVWLVGQPEPCLPWNVLPTSGQILRTVFYNHNILHFA